MFAGFLAPDISVLMGVSGDDSVSAYCLSDHVCRDAGCLLSLQKQLYHNLIYRNLFTLSLAVTIYHRQQIASGPRERGIYLV